jgi:glycosyltransferase involved in cell wall biosynthesis
VKLTLVITTYERPDALSAVLASVAAQSRLPDEVIVADDGSGPATAGVAQQWKKQLSCTLVHCRQAKRGFRLTRLRNMAIKASHGDYLIFIDGDMLLHREFIADHRRFARVGRYTQGVRILTNATLTQQLLATPLRTPGFFSSGLGGLRRLYMAHQPALSALLRNAGNHLIAIKGCNQAFWRIDLLRVNGYDEAIEGWGPEDKELCARMRNAGLRRQSLLAGGIAWHLYHPPASRAALQKNQSRLEATLAQHRVRCERGLDEHEPE